MRRELTLAWLYPDLMSTYGDRGNILSLQKRAEWREITVTLLPLSIGSTPKELAQADIIFMGGAQDRQQQIVATDMAKGKAEVLKNMIEDFVPGLYICGAYQFLGKYYKEADGTIIDCLHILDFHTENPGRAVPRLISDMAFSVDFLEQGSPLVGFENHGGRTYLGGRVQPLGKILKGFGNNGEDQTEGVHYKNTFGSYSHGPLLPKNPSLTDYLLSLALERKYKEKINVPHLDDSLEMLARQTIVRRLKLGV